MGGDRPRHRGRGWPRGSAALACPARPGSAATVGASRTSPPPVQARYHVARLQPSATACSRVTSPCWRAATRRRSREYRMPKDVPGRGRPGRRAAPDRRLARLRRTDATIPRQSPGGLRRVWCRARRGLARLCRTGCDGPAPELLRAVRRARRAAPSGVWRGCVARMRRSRARAPGSGAGLGCGRERRSATSASPGGCRSAMLWTSWQSDGSRPAPRVTCTSATCGPRSWRGCSPGRPAAGSWCGWRTWTG